MTPLSSWWYQSGDRAPKKGGLSLSYPHEFFLKAKSIFICGYVLSSLILCNSVAKTTIKLPL